MEARDSAHRKDFDCCHKWIPGRPRVALPFGSSRGRDARPTRLMCQTFSGLIDLGMDWPPSWLPTFVPASDFRLPLFVTTFYRSSSGSDPLLDRCAQGHIAASFVRKADETQDNSRKSQMDTIRVCQRHHGELVDHSGNKVSTVREENCEQIGLLQMRVGAMDMHRSTILDRSDCLDTGSFHAASTMNNPRKKVTISV
jgi:hypothetical protein